MYLFNTMSYKVLISTEPGKLPVGFYFLSCDNLISSSDQHIPSRFRKSVIILDFWTGFSKIRPLK